MKNLWRAMEKITFEKDKAKRDQAKTLLDIARDGVSFQDYRGLGEGIEAVCRSPNITMKRIKDRLSSPEKGRRPTQLFVDDTYRHVVERQFSTRR